MKLNLEEIKQISFTGIRRAYAFMGLGINAATNNSFNDYNLSSITKYIFLPTDFPENEIDKIKIEFKHWIISNGFQEFLGSFEVFLDNIHYVYLNVLTSKKDLAPIDAKEQHQKFKMKGVIKKLRIIENKLDFKSQFYKHINTINIARNCFLHRRGIVEKIDLNDDRYFKLSWVGMDIFIQKHDDSKVYIFPPDKCSKEEKRSENGEPMRIEWNEKSSKFSLGNSIKLETNEISEILMMMSNATNEIIKQLIAYLTASKIKIQQI